MAMECRINSSSEGATSESSSDLCRTFGALFRDDLETLGWHPMLVYIAPLVLKNFLCVTSVNNMPNYSEYFPRNLSRLSNNCCRTSPIAAHSRPFSPCSIPQYPRKPASKTPLNMRS